MFLKKRDEIDSNIVSEYDLDQDQWASSWWSKDQLEEEKLEQETPNYIL